MRLAILTNFIPPYRTSLFRELRNRVRDLRILVSVSMEPNRSWKCENEGLPFTVQRNIMVQKDWTHPCGFIERGFVHYPYETLLRLICYRPDVIISGEFGARTLQAALYRKMEGRTRLFVWATLSERTELGRGALRQYLRRILLRIADGFLVNGKSGARYLSSLGARSSQIFTIGQSVDEVFSHQPFSVKRQLPEVLFYAGRLVKAKGIDLFVEALRAWARKHPDRKVEFRLAGDGPC